MTQEPLPHWDLSNVFPGLESDEFAKAVSKLGEKLDALDVHLDAHQIAREGLLSGDPSELSAIIAGYLDRMNGILELYGTLEAYLYSFMSTDSYNTTARRLMSEVEPLGVRLERQEVRFRGWIGRLAQDAGRFQQVLALEGPASEHAFYLQEAAEQSRFIMSEAEEALGAELALSGIRAWSKLQEVVTSQLNVEFEREGQVERLPITVVLNLRTDPDPEIRRQAYKVDLSAWESVREPLAACMNGVKGTQATLNRHRGRVDALHEPLDQARIDRETLEAMLGAMHDVFPAFRRYWRAKAVRLHKERLPWWDLFAPVGKSQRRYSFAEAQSFVLGQFDAYSHRLARLAQRAFDNYWIDAEPRDGKGGGAFCMGIPSVEESRVLCNFDGSRDQVMTLAHELGHAYHNECQVGKRPLQRETPMTLAETASIFCETIITDAMLARAANPDEELAILETFLTDASQTVVDIYSRYLFEKEVFERRAQAELSADDFCEIMTRAQLETYGDGLDPDYLHPYMWAWKPHYYIPGLSFYNFPYAFGLLFGLGLYAVYQERGESFLADYDELLRSTGEGTAAELAARFGLDIRERAFWEESLKVVEKRIDRYQAL